MFSGTPINQNCYVSESSGKLKFELRQPFQMPTPDNSVKLSYFLKKYFRVGTE